MLDQRFSVGRFFRAGHLFPALLLILGLLLSGIPTQASTPTLNNIYLMGPGGVGGTVTLGLTVYTQQIVGTTAGGTVYWIAQSFHPVAGIFSQFTLSMGPNTGTPSGTVTWELHQDYEGLPGSVLQTGSFTPTANAINTVSITQSVFITDDLYWLLWYPTTPQTSGNSWSIRYSNTAGEYTGGHWGNTQNGVYYTMYENNNVIGSISTASGAAPAALLNDFISQSFITSATTTLSGIKIALRKYNLPTGTMTLSLERDFGNQRSSILVDAAATTTLAESALTTNFALTDFAFASPVTLPPGKYWIVLTTSRVDSTKYVAWEGAAICAGDGSIAKVHVNGVWAPVTEELIFAPDLTAITPIATEAPDSSSYVSLPSGATGRIDLSINAGQIFESSLSMMILIVGLIVVFLLLIRRRE